MKHDKSVIEYSTMHGKHTQTKNVTNIVRLVCSQPYKPSQYHHALHDHQKVDTPPYKLATTELQSLK